jgi:hypothetical protein
MAPNDEALISKAKAPEGEWIRTSRMHAVESQRRYRLILTRRRDALPGLARDLPAWRERAGVGVGAALYLL